MDLHVLTHSSPNRRSTDLAAAQELAAELKTLVLGLDTGQMQDPEKGPAQARAGPLFAALVASEWQEVAQSRDYVVGMERRDHEIMLVRGQQGVVGQIGRAHV